MAKLAGYNARQLSTVIFAGTATAGTTTLPILRAPFGGVTVTAAYLMPTGAVTADGTDYLTGYIYNQGASGTAAAGTVGVVGGTAGVPLAPNAFALTTANVALTAGQWLTARIVKTGAITQREYSVVVEYVGGKG